MYTTVKSTEVLCTICCLASCQTNGLLRGKCFDKFNQYNFLGNIARTNIKTESFKCRDG